MRAIGTLDHGLILSSPCHSSPIYRHGVHQVLYSSTTRDNSSLLFFLLGPARCKYLLYMHVAMIILASPPHTECPVDRRRRPLLSRPISTSFSPSFSLSSGPKAPRQPGTRYRPLGYTITAKNQVIRCLPCRAKVHGASRPYPQSRSLFLLFFCLACLLSPFLPARSCPRPFSCTLPAGRFAT